MKTNIINHHINRLKESTDVEKEFDKIQHHPGQNSQQTRNRGNFFNLTKKIYKSLWLTAYSLEKTIVFLIRSGRYTLPFQNHTELMQ